MGISGIGGQAPVVPSVSTGTTPAVSASPALSPVPSRAAADAFSSGAPSTRPSVQLNPGAQPTAAVWAGAFDLSTDPFAPEAPGPLGTREVYTPEGDAMVEAQVSSAVDAQLGAAAAKLGVPSARVADVMGQQAGTTGAAWLAGVRADVRQMIDLRTNDLVALLTGQGAINGGPGVLDGGLDVTDGTLRQCFARMGGLVPSIVLGDRQHPEATLECLRAFARAAELGVTTAEWKPDSRGSFTLNVVLPETAETAQVLGRLVSAYGIDPSRLRFSPGLGETTNLATLVTHLRGTVDPKFQQAARSWLESTIAQGQRPDLLPLAGAGVVGGEPVPPWVARAGTVQGPDARVRVATVSGQPVYLVETPAWGEDGRWRTYASARYDLYDSAGLSLGSATLDYSAQRLAWAS